MHDKNPKIEKRWWGGKESLVNVNRARIKIKRGKTKIVQPPVLPKKLLFDILLYMTFEIDWPGQPGGRHT